MTTLDRFLALTQCGDEKNWSQTLFQIASELGFEYCLLALIPDPTASFDHAYTRSNYPSAWRELYESEGFSQIDPTVAHCAKRVAYIVWAPEIFETDAQKSLYEKASSYGLRSGVCLPIHGPRGERGLLNFITDNKLGKAIERNMAIQLPALCLLRDIVFDTAIKHTLGNRLSEEIPTLTPREHECLNWTAIGKTTWEISKILNVSEATTNFHIANIRQKLDVSTRREAVVKAIRLGLINLP